MSDFSGTVSRLFGGPGDEAGRLSAGPTTERVGETISATTSRRMKGPQRNGHYSFHGKVTSAFGATSTLTIWYSNLPNPDGTSDADWVQDTSIAAIDLTSTNGFFQAVGNVCAEYVRFKVTRNTSDGALWLFVRSEGVSV